MLQLRNYAALNRLFAGAPQITAILASITATGAKGASIAMIAQSTTLKPIYVDRVVIWLLKYDFIRRL